MGTSVTGLTVWISSLPELGFGLRVAVRLGILPWILSVRGFEGSRRFDV